MTSLTHLEEGLINGDDLINLGAPANGENGPAPTPSTSVSYGSSSTCSQGQPPPPPTPLVRVMVTTTTPTQPSTLTSTGQMGPPLIPKPKPKRWVSRNKYLLGSLSLSDDDDEERGRTKGKGNKGKTNKGQQENTCYVCDLCDGKFSSSSSLQKHQRVHTGERPFECTICSKRFVTKFALERHAIGHDPNSSKAIVCSICDKRFSTKEWLVIHVRSHTGDTPFNCDACEKKFTSQSSLNRHALTHKSEKGYLCQECGKLYQSSQAMRVHLESHGHGPERNYPCPKCRMRFRRALDLQRHSMTHRDVQMLPCPLPSCEHQFRRKDNLLRHLQLTHNQTREEAHETFNMLNTSSSKTSECNDSDSAPGSVSASSDNEIPSAPASLNGIDESPRTTGGRSNRRKNNQNTTKTRVKRSQRKNTTVQNPKSRKRKNPQVQSSSPPPAAVSEDPDSSLQSIPIEENMPEITTLLDPKCTQIPVQPTTMTPHTALIEDTTYPPTKSVTTSVIMMAKSTSLNNNTSSQQQNHPYHHRKKYKRANEDTTTNTELDDDINYDNHPKSPSSNTLSLQVPYPTRNISPGQEYINYLNNLNNPIAYRVRDRSSSFQNRQSLGISSSRNYGQNNSNRMEPSYPKKYSEHEVSYNSKENQNDNNFSDVMSTNQQINIHQTGNPDTFTFQGNNYDISASAAPGYFQPPQIQYQLADSEIDPGYLDLSLSSPPDSMYDRRNNSSFPPSSSMRSSSYSNGSNLVPTSSYYTMETNGLNYDQQQQFISEDLTPLCYVQSLSQQENSKESMTRNVSSNYDGGYYETQSSSSLTYSVMQPLLESSGDMYQNQEISLTQHPPHLVDYIEENCERPFNVTVIKRASASHQHEQPNTQNVFQESHYQRHFQDIQDFTQVGSSSSRQHIISESSIGLGVGPISITLSSSEDETGPSSTGNKILYQHPYHHGGKDMIVNRDPRKNFLHRESRNKYQQD